MRSLPTPAAKLLGGLCLTLLQLLAFTHAAAPAREAGPAAVLDPVLDPVLSTVEQYVAAFRAAYQPGVHERRSLNAAEAAFTAAGHEFSPRLTLAQVLDWDAYATLALELEAGVELPLLSSTAELERDLAALDLESRRLALGSAGEEAYAALLVDLANLAAVTWAAALVGDALDGFDELGFEWHAAAAHAAVGYVQPRHRETFGSYQRLLQAEAWLGEQSEVMVGRLARSLAVPRGRLRAPRISELERWLATGRTGLPGLAACQGLSSAVVAATLRHARGLADDALLAMPRYSLTLKADVGYEFAPWSTGAAPPGNHGGNTTAGLDAAIALEGRYLVPDGWPLGGNAELLFGLDGASQRLNLAWPPLPVPATVEVDRDEELDRELASIAVELGAMRSAAALAATDLTKAERQLTWAIIDAAPSLTDDEIRWVVADAVTLPSLGLLEPTTDDASIELHLAELRLEHAFARLAAFSAHVQYLAACGQL